MRTQAAVSLMNRLHYPQPLAVTSQEAAARAAKMAAVSYDSSDSSDEETLRRCQEAVWETKMDKNKGPECFNCANKDKRSKHFCFAS